MKGEAMQRWTFHQHQWVKYGVFLFCILFLFNLGIGAAIKPQPLELMKAKVEEFVDGKAKNLLVKSGGYSFDFLGRSAHCEFKIRNQPRENVYIEIRKPLHILPWRVSEYRTVK